MANYSMNTIEMDGIAKENLLKEGEFDLKCIDILECIDFEHYQISHTEINNNQVKFDMYKDAELPAEFLVAFSKKYSGKKVTYIYAPECDFPKEYVSTYLNGKLVEKHENAIMH